MSLAEILPAVRSLPRTEQVRLVHLLIDELARPEDFIGLARQQTERFLMEDVDPILERERQQIHDQVGEVRV